MVRMPPERVAGKSGCYRMETPNDYRKYAEECRRLAAKADTEQHKAILDEMAATWSRLAAEAERKAPGKTDVQLEHDT
jgi:hypothetical protein